MCRARTQSNEVAELLDAALLSQAPAGPDRTQAADWALRATTAATAGATVGPQLQLASLYLTANADPDTGIGLAEPGQMARACGTHPACLPNTLDQLTVTGLLSSWYTCPNWGDLHRTLAYPGGDRQPVPSKDPEYPADRAQNRTITRPCALQRRAPSTC